jgi:integrase
MKNANSAHCRKSLCSVVNDPSLQSEWSKTKERGIRFNNFSKAYYANCKVHGRTIGTRLGATLEEAKTALAKLRSAQPNPARTGTGQFHESATFQDILAYYKQIVEGRDRDQKTKDKRHFMVQTIVKSWIEAKDAKGQRVARKGFADCRPAEISKAQLQAWRLYFLREFSANHWNNALLTLRELLDIAEQNGLCKINLARAKDETNHPILARARILDEELTIISPKQLQAILAELDKYEQWGGYVATNARYVKDFVEGLAATGLRLNEAKQVKAEHVHLDKAPHGWLWVPKNNTKFKSKARWIPLFQNTRPLFERLVKEADPETGKLFKVSECQKTLDKVCIAAEVPRMTHHGFRHYFASVAYNLTKDAKIVAEWLGHSDGGILVMKLYAHVFKQYVEKTIEKAVFGAPSAPAPANVIELKAAANG